MNGVIGVLGGMGTYATIHLFQQYARVFSAEKEWDRPRIIIDNRCTMPSRVRAFLFDENREQLVKEMTESLLGLMNLGCDKIILACNTSHLFLPEIYKMIPDLQGILVNIIDVCVDNIVRSGVLNVFLLGSEGTLESNIFQNALEKKGVNCLCPSREEYQNIRKCIEAVKKNQYKEEVKDCFIELVDRFDACILGCTELPVLYEKYKNDVSCKQIFDPLYMSLLKIREIFLLEGN